MDAGEGFWTGSSTLPHLHHFHRFAGPASQDGTTRPSGPFLAIVERTTDVFFYGWFMDPDLLRDRGLRPVDPRLAFVDGYRLRIGERAALEPAPGDRAHGIVMRLAQTELDRLYADPGVSMYRPEVMVAHLPDGSSLEVLCYNTRLAADSPVNHAYVERWRSIAMKVGLPEPYVVSAGSGP